MSKDAPHQEAEKKIEEALRSEAKELDLSGQWDGNDAQKLTELPESLGELTQLQSLDLARHQLTVLPDSLGNLTQLQSLDLGYNQLTVLPDSLGKLTQLQSLKLLRNQLTVLPDSLGQLTQLQSLDLGYNQLTVLPHSLGKLTQLKSLDLARNQLTALPESLGQLKQLTHLFLQDNRFAEFPEAVRRFEKLFGLRIANNHLKVLPSWISELRALNWLDIESNQLTDLPESFGFLVQLEQLVLGASKGNPLGNVPTCIRGLKRLFFLQLNQCNLKSLPVWISDLVELGTLDIKENQLSELPAELGRLPKLKDIGLAENPLNPELAAADKEGLDAVKRYLRAKAEAQVVLNEAKLIVIGEGEVGKSALLGALRGDEWVDRRDSTHGIEIKPVKVTNPATGTEITLNGWDFGGQRVYRPTHQFFFSAPAVYLVVWKPREGSQAGAVKEWVKLVKHREPEAKILVVATHGGPKERQPDIDRQEIWDLFGKDTVIDFFHVESRPPKLNKKTGTRTGACKGIKELKDAIASLAASLPEVGRSVPKHWQEAREALQKSKEAYLPLDRVFAICREHKVGEEDAGLLIRICRRVGDLIYYEHDPLLRDIVVLKPDWLATAISFVLDDKETRDVGHGLVKFDRLGLLWEDSQRPKENRYPAKLHPIFLRLMERFDLSYRIAEGGRAEAEGASLIAQLVPDVRPEKDVEHVWPETLAQGDEQQLQICRIVETANNQSATAEGLFYQLIVRLHKFSLGRLNFQDSVHWQRGLMVEDDTGARAFLEHIGNDVRITVRSPYPPRFLSALTYEVKWLVESFWTGLRCDVTVPCLVRLANGEPCKGLFEVGKLLENKRRGRPEQPCAFCNEWQNIDQLLDNAPAARANPIEELLANQGEMMQRLDEIRVQLAAHEVQVIGRFDRVDATGREIISKVEDAYTALMQTLVDEAKEGPRLFSFEPVEPGFFDRPKWMSAKFRLTLWCEHSRRPLWFYSNGTDAGVYTIDLPREWLLKAAPFLKVLASTLGLLLPVVAATAKVALPEISYKGIEAQLALGKATSEALLKGSEEIGEWLVKDDDLELPEGTPIRAAGGVLRQLHAWLKAKDPTFGGLVRVQNKRQEFLWVHPSFEAEY